MTGTGARDILLVRRNGAEAAVSAPAGTEEEISALVRRLLVLLGEDPDREGLRDTPGRVARSLRDLTVGYDLDGADAVGGALFPREGRSDGSPSPVVVERIPFYSLCEHHLLPFFGGVRVAYVPDRWIVGLSKIARVVEVFARRLQVQERLTEQIADALVEEVRPQGVAVSIEARHLCMEMRGVQRPGVRTSTSAFRGVYLRRSQLRESFLRVRTSNQGVES